ncbi:hypothetical protein MUK42_14423 [Musa troglodytarum]|uniref:NAC domain-containing protein n=1 Tax=Musa troglodytarum TaxID=320322 RepID=A0A9E7KGM1_9LILI|nr:hypothetical protein MUK42_14423 [Musa troglodytarum]
MAWSWQVGGIQFRPTPQQLVNFFLTSKHRLQPINEGFLPEANVYGDHPANTTGNSWLLLFSGFPAAFPMSNKDGEWFFFTHRSPPLGNGKRASRTAGPGRWKATQATKDVVDDHGRVIGRQSFCYQVQSPSGYIKSDWLMEEYARSDASERLWVICKVYMTPKARAKLLRGIIGASNTVEEQETTMAPPHPPLPRLVDVTDPSGGDDRRKRRRTSTEDAEVVPAASVPVQRRSGVERILWPLFFRLTHVLLPANLTRITTFWTILGSIYAPRPASYSSHLLSLSCSLVRLITFNWFLSRRPPWERLLRPLLLNLTWTIIFWMILRSMSPERGDFWTSSSQLGLLTDAPDHIHLIPPAFDERLSSTPNTQAKDGI